MNRSVWKGPYVHNSIYKKDIIQIWDKSTTIIPKLVNKQIYVYNGKTKIKLIISEKMVGYKIGEFISMKKQAIYKKK